MIFVDTNVFVLALRYPRDAHANDNRRFLELIRERGDAVTSVLNVLEICGILSFNLNRRQLMALYAYFGRRFAVDVLPVDSGAGLVPASARELFDYVARRLSLGDALIAYAADVWAPDAVAFVSWDARHFRGKIAPRVLTPTQFLHEAS